MYLCPFAVRMCTNIYGVCTLCICRAKLTCTCTYTCKFHSKITHLQNIYMYMYTHTPYMYIYQAKQLEPGSKKPKLSEKGVCMWERCMHVQYTTLYIASISHGTHVLYMYVNFIVAFCIHVCTHAPHCTALTCTRTIIIARETTWTWIKQVKTKCERCVHGLSIWVRLRDLDKHAMCIVYMCMRVLLHVHSLSHCTFVWELSL